MEAEAEFPLPAFNPQRLAAACDRHPGEHVTGFCASCLRERLTGLDGASARRSCSASSALKSILFRLGTAGGESHFAYPQQENVSIENTANSQTSSSLFPELRRCKSLAGGKSATVAVEPQRKSCDARVRRTLWSLFDQDDRNRSDTSVDQFVISSLIAATAVSGAGEIELADSVGLVGNTFGEKKLEAERPMKDHIDLESQAKKVPPRDLKEIAGSFWLAASLFSKRLKKWRRKRKLNRSACKVINKPSSTFRPEGEKIAKSSHRFRDTQSEIAVDSFGRRSCDIAPRFSLDAGRFSLDNPRYPWDEPRASWDGYLINGGRSVSSQLSAKLPVDAPPFPAVQRSDSFISVEDSTAPGCSAQTRDYYSDSSSRRRRSLDRSSSKRRNSVELCDIKSASNSNASELFHWSKLEQESKVWGSISFREDCSGSFDSTFRNTALKAPPVKKSCRWSVWGFIHRRSINRGRGSDVVDRSLSKSWPEHLENGHEGKTLCSNSSLGARRSFSINGGLSSSRKSSLEINGQKKKKKENKELLLERSKSSRYSPSHFDNGLLRFYLTPVRGGSRRRKISPKRKFSSPGSFTSSLLRLY